MKTQNDNSVKDQNATCDNNMLANRLFRGFSIKHNNWIYGDLIHTPEKRMRIINYTDISSDGVDNFVTINEMVETKSVGQFVGLFDIKADDIYEGDIIQDVRFKYKYVVVYEGNQYVAKSNTGSIGLFETEDCYKIIGNRFQNPELLQEVF